MTGMLLMKIILYLNFIIGPTIYSYEFFSYLNPVLKE